MDDERQLIVAADVTANASDQGQLLPRLDEVEAAYGAVPARVLADAGYCNERDLSALEEKDVDGYVALGREGKKSAAADAAALPATARMRAKLASGEGRAAYARRKWLSEAPNGWIKQSLGFRRFSVRGLRKVQGECALVCLALNMKQMQRLAAA